VALNLTGSNISCRENAVKAASGGAHGTSIGEVFLGVCLNRPLSGGTMRGKMSYDIGNGTYRSARAVNGLLDKPASNMETVADVWNRSCEKFAQEKCMGWRDILSMTKEGQKERFVLGGYNWLTYRQAHRRSTNFGRGLASLGVKKGDMINFFAETKMEWQLACQGCMQFGFVVTTTYANLGAEAVAYGIRQTKSTVVFTEADLVPTLAKILPDCPTVKHLVFTPDKRPSSHPASKSNEDLRSMVNIQGLQLHSFEEVEKLGEANAKLDPPKLSSKDIAMIMYTSGSTGNPKGILISSGNLVAAIAGCADSIPGMGLGDYYVAYLPLAHILEVAAETACLATGVAIGYGSTKTITDASVCIEPGKCKGDASELQPTLMAAVPMIMDKIRAVVLDKVNKAGGVTKKVFDTAYNRKLRAIENGFDTPFWNKILFDNLRAKLLGGRVRYILSGGGPLSKDTQDFMNVVFCCPVGQGYGLTEVVGVATTCWPNDRTAGRVGAPITSMEIRLEDWEEGGYYADPSTTPEDERYPNPRGEVHLGGPQVTQGYFEEPEKTEEAFYTDAEGTRWMRTGDIGEIFPDGALKIIDRKKDLVKLAGAEYVSFGKLEPMLRDSEHVDNAMVYADSEKSYCVAVVQTQADCSASDDEIYHDIVNILKRAGCAKFEIPKRIYVEREIVWGPENDLCTAALKLKRRNLQKHYSNTLKDLYKDN